MISVIIVSCVLVVVLFQFAIDVPDYMFIGEVRNKSSLSFELPESQLRDLRLRMHNPGLNEVEGGVISVLCTGTVQVVCKNEFAGIAFDAIELRRVHVPVYQSEDYAEYSLSFRLEGKDLRPVRRCLLVGRSCMLKVNYAEIPRIDATMWVRYHEPYGTFLVKRLWSWVRGADRVRL
jgi:hypothetical protein